MISTIEIEGLRGIREGKLDDLAPLTILVGPNGSGKSTVLESLFLAATDLNLKNAFNRIIRGVGPSRHARWLFYRSGKLRKLTIKAQADPGKEQISRAMDCDPDATSFSNERGSIFSRKRLPEARLVNASVFGLAPPLHELFTAVVKGGRRADVNDAVSKIVRGATHVEILTEGNQPVLHVVFPDYSVPAQLVGDGIHTLLRVVCHLAISPGGLVLLEEPEAHQHPGAIRLTAIAILAAIQRGVQVVLSTHSLELIDALISAATEEDLRKIALFRLVLSANGELKSSRLAGEQIAFERFQIEDDLR